MADDKNNDEYQFADPDLNNPESFDELQEGMVEPEMTGIQPPPSPAAVVRRNAIIAIIGFVVIILLYKFIASFFSSTEVPTKPASKEVIQPIKPIAKPEPIITPVAAPAPMNATLDKRLSDIESSQQTMRADLDNLKAQVSGINSNLSGLSSQLNQLNQLISSLSSKIDEQSAQIESLIVKQRKPQVRRVKHQTAAPRLHYNIQAIIPGRAWLIATNGSTLTVREGSSIPGYGIVKLIDPNQGRVTTSSGQIIKFSQQDS